MFGHKLQEVNEFTYLGLNPSSRVQTRPKPLDFAGVRKILSMPSSGGEVKESVPCPSFAACKKS